jgi:hypothetical protein
MPKNRAFLTGGGASVPATATGMPRSHRAVFLGVLILGACSSGSKVHSHPTDGPVDRPTDLPVDSPADAAAGLPVDSVADAGADQLADTVADASTDVQADAGGTDTGGADARMCFTDASTA